MADLVMRKRAAMHAGEIGLFIDSQVFEEDFGSIKTGVDIEVKATQGRNLKQMRLGWAIAARIAQSGVLGDADRVEVMDYILMKCRHVRYVSHRYESGIEETIPVVKSIRFAAMDGTAFDRLFNRMIYIVTSEILPDMPEGELRAEVEKLAGVSTPEPEQKRPRGRPRRLPDPVSVIPADEPVTAGVPTGQPASEEPPPETQATPNSDPAPEPVTQPVDSTSTPPPAQPAPSSSPAQSAGQAVLPTNFATWQPWALAWIAEYRADAEKSDQDMMIRWNGERYLRNKCGVTGEERQPIFEVYTAAVEEKQKRGKPI